MRRWQLVIDDTGSVEGIYAFIYCTKWRSGQVLPMPDSLTDSLTTLKDRATQFLIKYKSGALVTQFKGPCKETDNTKTKNSRMYPRPDQRPSVLSAEEGYFKSGLSLGLFVRH